MKVRTRREATWRSSSSSRRGKRSANGAGALLRSVREDVGKEEEQSQKNVYNETEAGKDEEKVCLDSSGKLRKDGEEWEVKVEEEAEDKCVFCKCQQHVICKLRKCQQTKGGTK